MHLKMLFVEAQEDLNVKKCYPHQHEKNLQCMKNHPKNYWHSHKEIFQRHYTRASQGKDTGGGQEVC